MPTPTIVYSGPKNVELCETLRMYLSELEVTIAVLDGVDNAELFDTPRLRAFVDSVRRAKECGSNLVCSIRKTV